MPVKSMKDYMRNRRRERREFLIEKAGNKCKKCNSKENLEFDHRDKKEKLFNLSGFNLDKKWDIILDEYKKCDLLCFDCHKKKTKQFGDLSKEPWNKNINLPFLHGTARMYSEKSCRCLLCKKAKRLYRGKEIGYSEDVAQW